jgi:hypothetical protein
LATTNKNFKVKNGLEVGGNGTFDGAVSAQSFNVPYSRTNLVTNPNLETNLTDWYVSSDGSYSRVNTTPKNGSWCLRVDPNFVGEFVQYTKSNALTVGITYTASAWVRSESGSQTIELTFYAGTAALTQSITATTSWQQITVSNLTATVNGNLQLNFRALSGGSHFIDSVIVETTSSYEGFFDGNTPGAAWTGTANASTSTTTGTGTVSVANLSGATFTGSVTAPIFNGKVALANVTGLGFNIATFLASPSSTNLLNAVPDESGTGTLVFSTSPVLTTPNIGAAIGTSVNVTGNVTANLITATSVSGTSVSAQSFSTAAFSRTNLVLNPNFEANTTGWSTDYGNISRVGTTPQTGSWCLEVTPDGDGDLSANYSRANALTVGTSYRGGIWVRISSGTFGMRLTLQAGAFLSSAVDFTATTSWQFVQTPAVTANSTTGLVLRVAPPNSYAGFGGSLFVDSAIVETASTYNGSFFDGNTPDTSNIDYAWTGTANASTSTATGSAVGLATLAGGTFTGNIAGTNISMSGNVNAVTVNATTLIGNTNASTITTGTIANARTSANSANGASTIVARDANGSFTANVVSATTFSGSGASLTSIPNSSLVNNSITINGNAVALGGNITIAGSSGNSFETISANGTSVVADSSTDTLTITPGSGMSIVGNATSDTITFSVNGGLVPSGGTAGQILSKSDSTDYNTVWINEAPAASYTSVVKHDVRLGEAITKGQAVYVSSSNGSNMVVSKASNATEGTSSKALGLLETSGSTNNQRNVVTEGLLGGIDVGSAVAGDPVWLGTSGNLIYGLTNKPIAPAHLVFIGIVTRTGNNGEIFVRPQNGFELNEIHNVLIGTDYSSTPADNDLLAYDSGSSLWKNQTASAAGLQTTISVGNGLSISSSNITVNPGAMLNQIVDGTSGNSYGLVGTSAYLDVKDTNGYNKEIELDIAAVESKLTTDGFVSTSGATFTGNVAGTNISMSGNANATTFYGSGAGLTSIPSIVTDDTKPATPVDGQVWFNASTGKTYVYYVDVDSGQWVEIFGAKDVQDLKNRTTTLESSITSIPNSSTTANSANGASTIVARNATGNFNGNVITASLFSGTNVTATNRVTADSIRAYSSANIGGTYGSSVTALRVQANEDIDNSYAIAEFYSPSGIKVSEIGYNGDFYITNVTADRLTVNSISANVTSIANTTGTIFFSFNTSNSYLTMANVTGTVTFTTSDYQPGKTVTIRIINASASSRTINLPAGWVFVGPKPTTIAALKTGILTITSFGTTEANCVAAWAVQV